MDMPSDKREEDLKQNSLLLYKTHPARLLRIADRLEIELENGDTVKVRPKDVTLLHPGPLNSLSELETLQGEVQAAWEILSGGQTNLPELAELAYGAYTPASAWSAWQQVAEGFYFDGSPDQIMVYSADEVAHKQQVREQAAAEKQSWQDFLSRASRGEVTPEDQEYLRDVENLALGRSEHSQVLRALGHAETPDNAYAQLLTWNIWDVTVNPYPARFGVAFGQPQLPVPPLPQQARRDLTDLPAYAIDDESTDTPDDAISLEGSRVWVHVADVAALVPPDTPLDLEARARGSSLHLPEGTLHMLPREVTERLGLGIREVSPALSFGIDLDDSGQVTGFEVVPSLLRVTRLTYEEADARLAEEPFRSLEARMSAVRRQRQENNAVLIDFPEVKIAVEQGLVHLKPLLPLRSRALVEEAMILTSAQIARFAIEHNLPVPFSQQEAVATPDRPETLSGMFALRRLLKRSHFQTSPGPHSGLGVAAYTQTTSPLRRYLDLVTHQQVRALLAGNELLGEPQLVERIGAYQAVIGNIRQAEILSEKHWTLVYLLQHPDWRGEGILVDKRGATGVVIIPSLAVEARVHLSPDLPLDSMVSLQVSGINLAQRDVHFRVDYRAMP